MFPIIGEVVIRTNDLMTNINIQAPADIVRHYGIVGDCSVEVAPHSYYENGSASSIDLKKGHLVIDSNSFVGSVNSAANTTIENKGTIAKAVTGAATISGSGINGISESSSISIGSADALMNLAFVQSKGILGDAALSIELTKDIDLSEKEWIPFGAEYKDAQVYPFEGTINGNNHKILGLHNGNLEELALSINGTTRNYGSVYGFIAYTKGNVSIKNLAFKEVNINAPTAKVCAAVIGDTDKSTTSVMLDNVDVEGSITAQDKVAGLVAYFQCVKSSKLFNNANEYAAVIKNCEVKANVTACGDNGFRAGGLFSQIKGTEVNVKDCKYTGEVNSVGHDGGNAEGKVWGGTFAAAVTDSEYLNNSGYNNNIVVEGFVSTGATVKSEIILKDTADDTLYMNGIPTIGSISWVGNVGHSKHDANNGSFRIYNNNEITSSNDSNRSVNFISGAEKRFEENYALGTSLEGSVDYLANGMLSGLWRRGWFTGNGITVASSDNAITFNGNGAQFGYIGQIVSLKGGETYTLTVNTEYKGADLNRDDTFIGFATQSETNHSDIQLLAQEQYGGEWFGNDGNVHTKQLSVTFTPSANMECIVVLKTSVYTGDFYFTFSDITITK